MEIIPGIHQLKLPVPAPNDQLDHINVYLAGGDGDWLLVDAGWNTNKAFNSLEKQLGEIGLGVKDITRILITHLHVDHYGLAGRVKEQSGAEVLMHRVEKEFIESSYVNMDKLLAEIAQFLYLHGFPGEELPHLKKASEGMKKFAVPILPDTALEGGEIISVGPFNFEVLWTPGHSAGHICLYEPAKKILFSGDHILPTIFPNVGMNPQSGDTPLIDYLASLRAVKRLEIDLVLPAHENIFTDVRQRIDELYGHLRGRRDAILSVLKEGEKTAYEVSCRIPWILNGVTCSFEDLMAFDRRLAVMSALAYLEPLRAEGEVGRTEKEGIFLYSRR